VFSLGDVAETGGPKMARAGFVHAGIVQKNILALINETSLKDYNPISIEGMLKLSLGKVETLNLLRFGSGQHLMTDGET
jgi:NADH dehydrogenase FAD-containing subunit